MELDRPVRAHSTRTQLPDYRNHHHTTYSVNKFTLNLFLVAITINDPYRIGLPTRPTKDATSETVVRNFVKSIFLQLGILIPVGQNWKLFCAIPKKHFSRCRIHDEHDSTSSTAFVIICRHYWLLVAIGTYARERNVNHCKFAANFRSIGSSFFSYFFSTSFFSALSPLSPLLFLIFLLFLILWVDLIPRLLLLSPFFSLHYLDNVCALQILKSKKKNI